MLQAIHIQSFGIFRERSFALSTVTVFAGANQSGKSTLFDAIRIKTFTPDKRGKQNKALYERYGSDTEVTLTWQDGPPVGLADDAYMNLFAVSSGELRVDLEGDWLTAVKKNLFAGGIDPNTLIEAFEKRASDKGSLRHMRDLKDLREEQSADEERLDALRGQRLDVLAKLESQATGQAALKGLTVQLEQLAGRDLELAEEVGHLERLAERARAEAGLALLERVAQLERFLAKHAHLTEDRTGELAQLEAAAHAARTAQAVAEEGAQQSARALQGARNGEDAAREALAARQAWRGHAQGLENLVEVFHNQRIGKLLVRGTTGIASLLIGIAAAWFSGAAAWGWGVLAGGVLVAGGAAAWQVTEERRTLGVLRRRWQQSLGTAQPAGAAGLVLEAVEMAGLMAALTQVRVEVEQLETRANQAAAAVRDAEQALNEAQRKAGAMREASTAAQTAASAWLGALGMVNRDAYRDARAEYLHRQQAYAGAQTEMAALRQRAGFSETHALRADLERRLRDLEAQGLPRAEVDEHVLAERRAELARVRAELDQKRAEHHSVERARAAASGEVRGTLGRLPEEIADLESRLMRHVAKIKALEFDRQAARKTLSVLQAVAADETAVLADLSSGVGAIFGRLSGVAADAGEAATLDGLNNGDLQARDRQGANRAVEHLSNGARHMLYLALRLEMARRERQGRFALLCLDEPFAYLDPERQVETLDYLKSFLTETGWQLVLFTNEPEQAARVQAIFPEAQMHTLG